MFQSRIMLCDTNSADYFQLPSRWMYRGEGNCNIVISFPSSQEILRIRKTDRPKSILSWIIVLISDLLYWYCGKGFKDEMRDIKFYSEVMRPLIGYEYTSKANQVLLSRKQVKRLEYDLNKYRPDCRKHKCLQYGRATLFDDFTYLNIDHYDFLKFSENTYSVEIKPKQGWTPLDERVGNKCNFCINQFKKKHRNLINNITNYCPQDLFSGDGKKMNYAIKSLLEEPQNNFRIFKNGMLLYGEKTKKNTQAIFEEIFDNSTAGFESLQSEFCSFIQKCLLANLTSEEFESEQKGHFCEDDKPIDKLPKGCVLTKILSVQMLAKDGSEFYSKLLNGDNFDEWGYVSKLINEMHNKDTCLKCILNSFHENNEENADLAVASYLLAAVANDCSLMVTFRKVEELRDGLNSKNIFETKFGCYLVNVGVFDLYPKPMSTIKKHIKRNRENYESYMKASKEE